MNKNAIIQFCGKVKEQVEGLVLSHIQEGICTDVNAADKNPIRAYCDAVEILSMFDLQNTFSEKELLLNKLKQANTSEIDYTLMCVGYALENLGTSISQAVSCADELKEDKLTSWLDEMYNRERAFPAWSFGSDVDALGTAFYQNKKYFRLDFEQENFFAWLNAHINPHTGMWGSDADLLDTVNGFYRLTRGTYAQFNVDLPMPEKVIDTVLRHKPILEQDKHITACNTLDIIHPLWLCKKQTAYRSDEGYAFAKKWIEIIMQNWVENEGFAFELLKHEKTSMMGTEMWLSIFYLLCDYADVSEVLNYIPKGIHRPYTEI